MAEEKSIKLKFQNKEMSSPMPSSFDECKSYFKKNFSIDDEKMKKLSLFYTDKDGDTICLETSEDFLNFFENNEREIEGEILEDKENGEKILEKKEADNAILEGNEKNSEIKSTINEENNKESNLDSSSLLHPTATSVIIKTEIKDGEPPKEKEEVNKGKNFQKLEERISGDYNEKKGMKIINKQIEEKDDNNDIQKNNKIRDDKKLIDINEKKSSENIDNEEMKIKKEINDCEECKYNKNNNANIENANKNINESKINNKENINCNNKEINEHENNINNNNIDNNISNNNIKNDINNNNKTDCKINWFLILSFIVNLIAIMYFIYKKKVENKEKRIIIGIDFGSTASGYCIIYDSIINFDESDSKKVISSELIMDNETKIGLRIGNQAHYFPKNRIKPENKLYFSKFKKNLDPKNNNNYVMSNVPEGVQIELKHVIKGFLSLLREEIEFNNKRIKNTNINDIKWIITVPPLWDEKGKKFMKEVAYESGMIHSEIALEPEAASLSIFHDKNINKKYLEKGKKFLIVDAGGFTVDISANKIIDDNHNLEQLLKPSSELFGSNLINERIIEIIETIYGKSTIEEVKKIISLKGISIVSSK